MQGRLAATHPKFPGEVFIMAGLRDHAGSLADEIAAVLGVKKPRF
jgi:hypothetical protein